MATIKSIQDSIDVKANTYANNQLNNLSDVFKNYLVNNIDPAIYANLEVHKGLTLNKLFDSGSPVYTKLHRAYFIQEQTRLVNLAITKLS